MREAAPMPDPSRRSLLLAAPILILPALIPDWALAAIPAGGHLAFEAWRQGKKIGQHRLSFTQSGQDLTVHTEVTLAVGLGPITLFRYAHHATEHWRGGRFMALESKTEASDNNARVTAQRTDRGIAVDSSKSGKAVLSADAAPLTHWNLDALRPPLFNPQDGKLLKLASSRREETFTPNRGHPVRATKITLTGETPCEDWFDPAGLWIGLRAKAKDGSMIDYKRA